MKLTIHRNNVYLLGSLDSEGIISSRADGKKTFGLDLCRADINFVNERIENNLFSPIFLSVRGRAAFLIVSVYPICNVFELVTLELSDEKIIPIVKSGAFGTVAYHSRFDKLDGDENISKTDLNLLSDISDHMKSMTRNCGVVEDARTSNVSESIQFIKSTADFLGVDIKLPELTVLDRIQNLDRDLISAFTLMSLMFVRRAAKRRCGSIELFGDSKLWLSLDADCLDDVTLDEFLPLRQSTLRRDGCMRVTNAHGHIKIELCVHRADLSRVGLKTDTELM